MGIAVGWGVGLVVVGGGVSVPALRPVKTEETVNSVNCLQMFDYHSCKSVININLQDMDYYCCGSAININLQDLDYHSCRSVT